MFLVAVSKAFQESKCTGQCQESSEEKVMPLVANDKPTVIEQPTDRSLDLPAAFVSPKRASILGRGSFASSPVRTDQFDAPLGQSFPQRVAVGGSVIDQSFGTLAQDALLQERFDQLDFRRAGAGDVDAQRGAVAVDQEHDLRPFAALGLADAKAPFLAGENVPSAIASSQRIDFSPSSRRSSRDHACWKMPASVHSLRRRQHVAGDGKCVGKSFQRAPLFNTQRIPSRQGRGGIGGRPPASVISRTGKRSSIRFHCSSVSCGLGSVLDALQLRPSLGQ
jgi:hypothetical protein